MLGQFTGILLSADTIWNWSNQLESKPSQSGKGEIQALGQGQIPEPEALTAMVANMTRRERY